VEGKSVNVIHKKGNDIWLGTENGITLFNAEQGNKYFRLPDELVEYKEVWDIEDLDNGNLLVLNNFGKLVEFDGQSFSDYGTSIELPFLYINDVHIQNETLWMATESGVAKYQDGEYSYYTSEQGLADNYVWSLYEDQEGYMWAVSDQGLSRLEGDSSLTISIDDGFEGSSMSLMTQSPEGTYYVGTNVGFSELVIQDGAVTQISNFKIDPVFLQEPMFLLFDDAGNLWQGTNAGLHFFRKEQLSNYDAEILEGLFYPLQNYGKGLEFNFLSASIDQNEDIWFGTYTHGLIKYDNGVPTEKQPPKPFLRGFKVNNEVYPTRVQPGNVLGLEHDQDDVTFQIGAFYYENPQRIFYEYRLRESEESWSRAFNRTEINYTNLSPGVYSFEVKARSIQSAWSEPVAVIDFEINKPYWNTAWFYGLIILFIIIIMIAGVKTLLIYDDKKKLDILVDQKTWQLQNALSEKDILIKEIHHRVKNNMAVVSGLLDLQMWRMKDGEAKKAVENSKMRIQTMAAIHEKLYQNDNFAEIEFDKFTSDLISKISSSLKGGGKDIKVKTDIDSIKLDIQMAIPCGLILNEALSNAFEHAFIEQESGCVEVSFKDNGAESYLLIIKDNGIGIPDDLMGGRTSSLGITLMNALATQIKADLNFENSSGTTLTCIIPK
jgi:two-component sensor histidine kinase